MKVIFKAHGSHTQVIELESLEINLNDNCKFIITSDKHSQYESDKNHEMLLIQAGKLGKKLAIYPAATNLVRIKEE